MNETIADINRPIFTVFGKGLDHYKDCYLWYLMFFSTSIQMSYVRKGTYSQAPHTRILNLRVIIIYNYSHPCHGSS